jgi:hypothetical protein
MEINISYYTCPISGVLLFDPIMGPDGVMYDKNAFMIKQAQDKALNKAQEKSYEQYCEMISMIPMKNYFKGHIINIIQNTTLLDKFKISVSEILEYNIEKQLFSCNKLPENYYIDKNTYIVNKIKTFIAQRDYECVYSLVFEYDINYNIEINIVRNNIYEKHNFLTLLMIEPRVGKTISLLNLISIFIDKNVEYNYEVNGISFLQMMINFLSTKGKESFKVIEEFILNKILIIPDININSLDSYGNNIVFNLIKNELTNTSIIRKILQMANFDINQKNIDNSTILIELSKNKCDDLILLILDNDNIDYNHSNNFGEYPLSIMVKNKMKTCIIKLLEKPDVLNKDTILKQLINNL